jgi:ribosomal protein L19E
VLAVTGVVGAVEQAEVVGSPVLPRDDELRAVERADTRETLRAGRVSVDEKLVTDGGRLREDAWRRAYEQHPGEGQACGSPHAGFVAVAQS